MVNCPMKTENFSGNCECCNEKVPCMLKDILEQLHQLQSTVAEMKKGTRS